MPDADLFAPYQPPHRPAYDLANTYDRTTLAIRIIGDADRAHDYLQLVAHMQADGQMGAGQARARIGETLITLHRHAQALCRLAAIEQRGSQ